MDHVPHEIFPFIFNLILCCISYFYYFDLTHHRALILNFSVQSFFYFQIASKLSQVLTLSSSRGSMNLLHSKLSL